MSSNSRRGLYTGLRNKGNRSRREMDLIASVSRSGGLEGLEGDALKDFATQEQYRVYIQDKLKEFWRLYPRKGVEAKVNLDKQENILNFFRKLREGLISSKRRDDFAVEVYETSLYLAALFDNSTQRTAILTHLDEELYITNAILLCPFAPLIFLLHHLIAAYPLQSPFRQCLNLIPSPLLPRSSAQYLWITSLASSLHSLNYFKIEHLTRPDSFSRLLVPPQTEDSFFTMGSTSTSSFSSSQRISLARETIPVLVDSLRAKTREATWKVIRGAYRELSCHPNSETTRPWLERSLALAPVAPGKRMINLDQWLAKKNEQGEIGKKEGTADGRWVVYKRR